MKLASTLAFVPAFFAAACGGEAPRAPEGGMPVTISAPEGARYDLRCRFRAVEIRGQGMTNSVNLSGEGAREGSIPTDNARCTLKLTGGDGPVNVTIVAPTGEVSGSVTAVGGTAYLNVA